MKWIAGLMIVFLVMTTAADAAGKESKTQKPAETNWKPETFVGLAFRGIGPAVASGRVGDLAVHPNRSTYYVAVASGGVWKTENWGTTWTPIFDDQGSFSIGCISIDPNDPLVVWVGTGENNAQRSVAYGDGVYKSTDGGKTWENVGLKNSEHIGKIVIDPRNSKTVYVAAQGPLWSAGGDRGLYKTTDGGKTWNQILKISENTGVSDLVMDPRNPDVLYASAYQRRRHVWTVIAGGPESAVYKSTDAGATWKKLEQGLPKTDLGRVGLAISPADPNVLYAIVEAAEKEGGFFRSTDGGGSWEKRSDHVSGSGQYYQEIFADPVKVDRVYSMDVWMRVTEDGGKTFRKVGERSKHVDNHALWIDPENNNHLLAGCDGGVYETFDQGATWDFKANLPVTQFYKVTVDNSRPFYYVYGGTQDNNTLGGPSRTINTHGIMNQDWFVTLSGDGFQSQVDPEDPNIVYSQAQYGVLARFDRRSGERIDIQPQPAAGEPELRWNWDSPLIISPHNHTRLYFAAQRIFRSEDRGDNWTAVSPDLTRQIDRNKVKMMGRVWSANAVSKNASTSFYGNIVSLAESPVKEGLLFAGTDDGLIQISEDGGATWRAIERFPGVPDLTYVARITPSRHDSNTVYAAFNNHKMGDFKPYLLKSTDLGKSWTSIASNLPERGSTWVIVEDHGKPDLLFAGTEFGVFFTIDGGKRWTQLKGGIPVIAVRDLAIQMRENDLVVATFGRGFYILDDYTPLRELTEATLDQEAALFPVRQAWMFIPGDILGGPEKAFMGDSFYTAPNPPDGAVITYYLKEELLTRKKARLKKEKELAKEGKDVFYPSWEELEAEEREEEPAIVLTVSDEEGNVIRRLTGPAKAGFHRLAWDLRYPPSEPTQLSEPEDLAPWDWRRVGPLVTPGTYRVSASKRINGVLTPIGESRSFETMPLGMATLPAKDQTALLAFQRKTARLQRAVLGAVEAAKEADSRLKHLKKALDDTPGAEAALREETIRLTQRLLDLQKSLTGDPVRKRYNEPKPISIQDRVQQVVTGHWLATSAPTGTHLRNYEVAATEFAGVLEQLRVLLETDLKQLETKAETAGAPWTPGRVPRWNPE